MSDVLINATTKNNNFIFLNTSEQGINENIEMKNQKFQKKILKTIYSKDLIRRKIVGCRIYTNVVNQTFESEQNKYCRICIQDEEFSKFISPCKCKGSIQVVHEECLKMWILEQYGVNKIFNRNIYCEICKQKLEYKVRFVNRIDFCQFKKLQLKTKLTWVIQLIFMAICIYSSISIIKNFGINSLSIISFVIVIQLILLITIVYLCFSFLQAHKIEMIEDWQFKNYKPFQVVLEGQIFNKFQRINQIHCL